MARRTGAVKRPARCPPRRYKPRCEAVSTAMKHRRARTAPRRRAKNLFHSPLRRQGDFAILQTLVRMGKRYFELHCMDVAVGLRARQIRQQAYWGRAALEVLGDCEDVQSCVLECGTKVQVSRTTSVAARPLFFDGCVTRWSREFKPSNAGERRVLIGDRRVAHKHGKATALEFQSVRRWRSPESLLLPIGEALARMLAKEDLSDVKACEGATCTLIFADRTRGRSRRWCSMEICGNRAKQIAHRHRLKESR